MASTGRSSQGSGAGSRAGSGTSRGARGGTQSGGRGASAGEASLNASASTSGGSGGINIGGSAGVSGSTGAGGSAGSPGRTGPAGTAGARGNAELSGSAALGGQSQAPGARSQPGTSRTESERQVPIGREGQQQGRAAARVQGGAQGGAQGYGTPFGFMRRFGEEMDRLFSDFGFAPPGIESQLSLLGWPGSGGRSSLSLNASLPRGSANQSRSGSADSGSAAVSRPSSSGALASRGGWMPPVEVLQRGNDLVVRADLPGLRREDVHVEIDDGMLTVSGERRHHSESDEEGVYHSERSYGRFSRSIPLPPGTNEEAVQASFTDGVLEVTLPLPQEQSRARRVEIR